MNQPQDLNALVPGTATQVSADATGSSVSGWWARPVLHVTDVDASIAFYQERLGFTRAWYFQEEGRGYVTQVERQGCELILTRGWPEKVGKALMFISLNVEPWSQEAGTAAVDALRTELEARGAPVKDGRWGYRVLVVEDPDGNLLYVNYPEEHPPAERPV